LPEERVEILDPVREGQVERIDFEESSRLAYRRGGMVRIVVARATYKSSPQPAAPTDASPVTAHAAVEPLAPPVTIDTAVEPLATPATTHAPHAALSVTPPLDATPPHAHKGPRVVTFVTAKKPKELVERGIPAPTMIAHVLVSKYRWGLPFHRLARMFSSHGFSLDDGTMCRPSETKRGATCHTRSNVSWTTASVSTTAAK
jgi:transposase